MLSNITFSFRGVFIAGIIVVGIVAVGLWWANRSASSTQKKVQKQLQQASQNQNELTQSAEGDSGKTGAATTSSDTNLQAKSEDKTNKDMHNTNQTADTTTAGPDWKNYEKPSQDKLKKKLDPLVYDVTQEDGTESAYENELWDEKRDGIYVDILSGEPLFSSENKYKSGTGWPSFTKPLEPGNIATEADYLLGYRRTEVRSEHGDNHLGHVFDDGPETRQASGGAEPTGLRYCLNSAALKFIPKEQMAEAGYGAYLSLFDESASDN